MMAGPGNWDWLGLSGWGREQEGPDGGATSTGEDALRPSIQNGRDGGKVPTT